MNKFLIVILCLFSVTLFAQNRMSTEEWMSKRQQPDYVKWDRAVRAGAFVSLSGLDSVLIVGQGDTLRSYRIPVMGSASISIETTTTDSMDIQYIIKGGHRTGFGGLDEDYTEVNDLKIQPLYWINWTGPGVDSAYVEVVETSITTRIANSSPIVIPTLGTDFLQLEIISGTSHTKEDSVYIKTRITRQDD